jgi:Helix-turn-helix domain
MTEQETFTTRLRRHRERNRIALADISRDTRVKLELLEALERNDLSGWPKGLYARAYVRAYAAAIGLDGDATVNEFCRLFPHGDRRVESVIREIADIVASQSEFRYDYRYASETDRRNSPPPRSSARRHPFEGAVSKLRSWIGAIGRWPARDARASRPRHP